MMPGHSKGTAADIGTVNAVEFPISTTLDVVVGADCV
jgi:hypothetical protein